jgi:hypothetical protein
VKPRMLGRRRVTRRTLFVAKDRLLKSWLELQNRYHAAHTRRVSAALLRRPQAKLPRNSNQIARQRIRRFESYMPSHAVVSNSGVLQPQHFSAAFRQATGVRRPFSGNPR